MLSARLRAPFPRGEGGGYSGFQVTGIIEWGQKSKPKKSLELPTKREKSMDQNLTPKKSHAEFLSLNERKTSLVVLHRRTAPGIGGHYHESSDCSE